MELSVQDRLLLLKSLCAVEGSLATLRIVRNLQEEVGFSEEELEALDFREQAGRTLWKNGAVPPKEIEIGPAALAQALRMFEQLDKEEKLTMEYLPLYERLLKRSGEDTATKLKAV